MMKRWIAFAAAATFLSCSPSTPGTSDHKEAPKGDAPAAAQAPAAAAPAAGAAANIDKAKVGELIKRYYTSSGQIPDDVEMAITDIKPSEVTGLSEGSLRLSRGAQSQDVPFLISADGRWFLRADPVDLTIDPVQQVLSAIKLGDDNPSRGVKNSPVTIVEYSDFQCPFCARAEEIVAGEVMKAYGDKVTFVYKQFPLTSIHPWAEPASLIGLCVYKLGGNAAYWKYHETVFKSQKDVPNEDSATKLLGFAKDAGVDQAKVKECFDKGETKALVDASMAEAEEVGVNSTPTFFVNGIKLQGGFPPQYFDALIQLELKKAGR